MNIGGVIIKSPVLMAPIAGMTDRPYRRLVMEHGAGLVVSELISANALVRDSKKTFDMLPSRDEPGPLAAQIFGGEAEVVRDAALIVEERGGCDIIDINFGCPVKKVVKTGAGSAAMRDVTAAAKITSAVVAAVKTPVTVKTRIGWDLKSVNAVEFARAMEDAGAAAITVHGRTAAQMYSGAADWDVISEVARSVKIPVVGNGDIDTPETALRRLETSGCDMVMIGRAALGAPWIFRQFNELLASGAYSPVTPLEIKSVILSHLEMMTKRYGETTGVRKMRAHLGYYTKGLPKSAGFRRMANAATTPDELRRLVREYFYAISRPAADEDEMENVDSSGNDLTTAATGKGSE